MCGPCAVAAGHASAPARLWAVLVDASRSLPWLQVVSGLDSRAVEQVTGWARCRSRQGHQLGIRGNVGRGVERWVARVRSGHPSPAGVSDINVVHPARPLLRPDCSLIDLVFPVAGGSVSGRSMPIDHHSQSWRIFGASCFSWAASWVVEPAVLLVRKAT